jgi:hypothetical protein
MVSLVCPQVVHRPGNRLCTKKGEFLPIDGETICYLSFRVSPMRPLNKAHLLAYDASRTPE